MKQKEPPNVLQYSNDGIFKYQNKDGCLHQKVLLVPDTYIPDELRTPDINCSSLKSVGKIRRISKKIPHEFEPFHFHLTPYKDSFASRQFKKFLTLNQQESELFNDINLDKS